MESAYEVLGVPENSDLKIVKKAYIKLIKKYHPDINKDKEAAIITKKINMAYTSILNGKSTFRVDNEKSNINVKQEKQPDEKLERLKEKAIENLKSYPFINLVIFEEVITEIKNAETPQEIIEISKKAKGYNIAAQYIMDILDVKPYTYKMR